LMAHLATCPKCQAYRQQTLALNAKIRRALELDWQKGEVAPSDAPPVSGAPSSGASPPPSASTPVPASAPASAATVPSPATTAQAPTPIPTAPRRKSAATNVPQHRRPRLLALAASIVVTLVTALTIWLSPPQETLAAEIVKHVDGEPNSWSRTEPVSNAQMKAVLRKSGVKLGSGMQPVVYASGCWFLGHFVPHLVVMTKDGPVTVM